MKWQMLQFPAVKMNKIIIVKQFPPLILTAAKHEFVFNKIDDEFLINKSDINLFSLLENVIQQVVLTPAAQQVELTHSFYSDSSPPFLINPEIHITNSALLI